MTSEEAASPPPPGLPPTRQGQHLADKGGATKGSLTLKEKLSRMKSAPSFSLRIWRSLCKALSWSTL